MDKIKISNLAKSQEALTKEELKQVLGGIKSGISGLSIEETRCSTTCTDSEPISILCKGSCEAVPDNYVKCTDSDGRVIDYDTCIKQKN